jgi:hypothetical protein
MAGVLVLILLLGAGCVSTNNNPDITISSPDIDTLTPTNVGSFDLYPMEFHIKNPSNMTFRNVEVHITVIPSMAYCHTQSETVKIPLLYPGEKTIRRISIAEFGNLGCQYSYTYDVVSAS